MKKEALLYIGLIVGVFSYFFWELIKEFTGLSLFYIGNAFLILCLSLYIYKLKKIFITFVILGYAFNNFLDELLFNPTQLQLNELLTAIFVPMYYYKKKVMEKIIEFVNLLETLGIKLVLFIAGLGGGLASINKNKELTFWQRFLAILTGGFSANYLTPLVADLMNLKENTLYGIAFLLGYGGLKFVELAYQRISKLDKKQEKEE